MEKDRKKRAEESVSNGAKVLSETCTYCKGVRVMKEGKALCIKCGKEQEKREIPKEQKQEENGLKKTLEKKLESLSKELEQEADHEKQQSILKSINSVMETMDKIKEK